MAYDSPLSALEDVGRMFEHLVQTIPAAAGMAPMVGQYRRHLEDMRRRSAMRATEELPDAEQTSEQTSEQTAA